MNKYETIFVIDSLLKAEEIEANIAKFERFISRQWRQHRDHRPMGQETMAYEIKKRQYGIYVLIRFDAPGTIVKPLEREYRLNESICAIKSLNSKPKRSKHWPKPALPRKKPRKKSNRLKAMSPTAPCRQP